MLEYGNSVNDIRHRFTFAPTYAIPGKKSPGQMLEGWSVNGILTLQTGQPWSAYDGTNDFLGTGEVNSASTSGATGVIQPWDYTGPYSAFTISTTPMPCYGSMAGCTPYPVVGGVPQPPAACMSAAQANGPLAVASLMNFGCYVKGAGVLTPPAYGSIGTAGRNQFSGPGYDNVDFSVFKLWKLKERYSAEFRVEFFNRLQPYRSRRLGSTSQSMQRVANPPRGRDRRVRLRSKYAGFRQPGGGVRRSAAYSIRLEVGVLMS